MRLNGIYEAYKERMHFFCVYIKEAHPEDGWQVGENVRENLVFTQPRSEEERREIAAACVLNLRLAMPTLLDDMEDSTDEAYAALPERLYLVDTTGGVLFQSGPGPYGFDIKGWEAAIRERLASH